MDIVLCGDSTMAAYDDRQAFRGWGQDLGVFTHPHARISNLARCGASTKTFLDLGLWRTALALRPRWMLIQFGHNDSHHPDRPESTVSDGAYAVNILRMVAEAQAAHATPVLITPVCRRTWDTDTILMDNLAPYAEAVRRVAQSTGADLVDLHRKSQNAFQQMGRTATNAWSPEPGDFTHFNAAGARTVAGWVAQELAAKYPHGDSPSAAPIDPPSHGTGPRPEGY